MPTPRDPPLTVVLRLGDLERSVPSVAIAAVLQTPPSWTATRLAGLLRAAPTLRQTPTENSAGEATEGVPADPISSNEGPDGPDPNNRSERSQPVKIQSESDRTHPACPDDSADARAPRSDGHALVDELVHALGNEVDRAALARLVETTAAHVLREALSRTLAVPADRIRKNRSAYFAAVVRALRRRTP